MSDTMGPVRLLAFAGRQRSGKDTAIRELSGLGAARRRVAAGEFTQAHDQELASAVRDCSVRRVEWAGEIKRCAARWYGLSDRQIDGDLKEIVDPRYGKSPREIMRLLGTEVGRAIYDKTWVRHLMDHEIPREVRIARVQLGDLLRDHGAKVEPRTHPILICISGTRFPNEVAAVRAAGGRLIRIERPGLLHDNSHESERHIESLDVDAVVINDGTEAQLGYAVRHIVDGWWPA
jgi:hypothetical protein